MSQHRFVWFLVILVAGGCRSAPATPMSPNDAGPSADDAASAAPMPIPARIDTVVSGTTSVGTAIAARCELLDHEGNLLPHGSIAPLITVAPRESFREETPLGIIPVRPGDAIATCSAPELGLIDESPAAFEIQPGPAHRVVTDLDASSVEAGALVRASCRAYDAYGNPTSGTSGPLEVDPSGSDTTVDGMVVLARRSGTYSARCTVPGAPEVVAAEWEIRPSLPAHLHLSLRPERAVYAIGEVVDSNVVVLDGFGNRVPNAPVTLTTSSSDVDSFGVGRFRFRTEGRHRLVASVVGSTAHGEAVRAETSIQVNGRGPQIDCTFPSDGEMIRHAPGTPLTVQGIVRDPNLVRRVRVNGSDAALQSDGTFRSTLTPRFGINFLEIEAVDEDGAPSSRVCSFAASERWLGPDDFLSNAVTLEIHDRGIDDGRRDAGLSLGDLLNQVVRSDALMASLNQALTARNPVLPNTHLLRLIISDRTLGTQLTDRGFRMRLHLRGIFLRVRLPGNLGPVEGWIRTATGYADVEFALRVESGKPRIQVAQVHEVTLGELDIDLEGFEGWWWTLFQEVVDDEIRRGLERSITDALRTSVGAILDDLFSNLELPLSSNIDVPAFDGSPPGALAMAHRFDRVRTNRERLFLGIATRFSAFRGHARPTLGVAVPAMPERDEPPAITTTEDGTGLAASMHIGLVNQALHALWLGGSLDGNVELDNASVTVATALPPIVGAIGDSGRLDVAIGGVRVHIVHPTLFPAGTDLVIGGEASIAPELRGGGQEISLRDVAIDRTYVTMLDASVSAETQRQVEILCRDILQEMLSAGIEASLPAFPIPEFTIPEGADAYGLVPGRTFGPVARELVTTDRHLILFGGFGGSF